MALVGFLRKQKRRSLTRMNIVLYEPEIPANTGNIGRTCVVTGTRLHLIEPLGFSLDEKAVRRSGMDYWKDVDVTVYKDFQDFLEKNEFIDGEQPQSVNKKGNRLFLATTKAHQTYTQVSYGEDDYIMFGRESAGIPEEILVDREPECIRIPMKPQIRSLNLSNSVAIVVYEALRQNEFAGLEESGELHRLSWN